MRYETIEPLYKFISLICNSSYRFETRGPGPGPSPGFYITALSLNATPHLTVTPLTFKLCHLAEIRNMDKKVLSSSYSDIQIN